MNSSYRNILSILISIPNQLKLCVLYSAESIHFCKFASFSIKSPKVASSTDGTAEVLADFTATTAAGSSFFPEGFKLTRVKRVVYPARMSPETKFVGRGALCQQAKMYEKS